MAKIKQLSSTLATNLAGDKLLICQPCTLCDPHTTPRALEVTFAGVVMCTTCLSGGGIHYGRITSGTLNGTYTLDQIAPCQFLANLSISAATWTGGSPCTGTPSTGSVAQLNITRSNAFGLPLRWWVTCSVDTSGGPSGVGSGTLFNETSTALCDDTYSISNSHATCAWGGSGPNFRMAHSGSVQVTPLY